MKIFIFKISILIARIIQPNKLYVTFNANIGVISHKKSLKLTKHLHGNLLLICNMLFSLVSHLHSIEKSMVWMLNILFSYVSFRKEYGYSFRVYNNVVMQHPFAKNFTKRNNKWFIALFCSGIYCCSNCTLDGSDDVKPLLLLHKYKVSVCLKMIYVCNVCVQYTMPFLFLYVRRII